MAIFSRAMFLGALLCSCSVLAFGQQSNEVQWEDEAFFTQADRKAILTLAKILGLENPKRISHNVSLPVPCPFVLIKSAPSESGHLRTHFELPVYRKDWKCSKPEREGRRRVGRWFGSKSSLDPQREWKVEEAGWAKYVLFDNGVSYEDAELIVLAIKHGRVVNESANRSWTSAADPMDISLIRVKRGADRTFEVFFTGGDVYVVRIKNLSLELLEIDVWVV